MKLEEQPQQNHKRLITTVILFWHASGDFIVCFNFVRSIKSGAYPLRRRWKQVFKLLTKKRLVSEGLAINLSAKYYRLNSKMKFGFYSEKTKEKMKFEKLNSKNEIRKWNSKMKLEKWYSVFTFAKFVRIYCCEATNKDWMGRQWTLSILSVAVLSREPIDDNHSVKIWIW